MLIVANRNKGSLFNLLETRVFDDEGVFDDEFYTVSCS